MEDMQDNYEEEESKPTYANVSNDNVVAVFVLLCLHAVTNAHINHWRTDSFSIHSALQEFYSELGEALDAFVEAYMGKYGQIKDYPEFYALPNKDALAELKMLCETVYALREEMPDDSELENLLDNIESLIDTAMYKVKFLK
jgi:hypothetical protein